MVNASFYFMEQILTEMAHRGTLEHTFEQNIENWRKNFYFMGALKLAPVRLIILHATLLKIFATRSTGKRIYVAILE